MQTSPECWLAAPSSLPGPVSHYLRFWHHQILKIMRGLYQSLEPNQIPQFHSQNPRDCKLGSKHNLARLPRSIARDSRPWETGVFYLSPSPQCIVSSCVSLWLMYEEPLGIAARLSHSGPQASPQVQPKGHMLDWVLSRRVWVISPTPATPTTPSLGVREMVNDRCPFLVLGTMRQKTLGAFSPFLGLRDCAGAQCQHVLRPSPGTPPW